MVFHEQNSRSIIKALTFRVLIIISDAIIIFAITRRYDVTIGVIVFSNIASTVLYFIHERIWNKVHWGKKSSPVSKPIFF
jgi:adenylylsulfate kinase